MDNRDVFKAAEDWLVEIEFNEWHRFDEIPAELFEAVFTLIDEGFRGWLYFFDDFDQSFYKTLTYRLRNPKNHYEVNRDIVFENKQKQQARRDAKKVNGGEISTINTSKVLTFRSQC